MIKKKTKAMIRSPDGDTNFFDIVARVLQGDRLVPYLFMICLDYVLQKSMDLIKENGFMLKKGISREYPTETLTDYADYLALLTNTPV